MNNEFTPEEMSRIGSGARKRYVTADPMDRAKMVTETRKGWVKPETVPFTVMVLGLFLMSPITVALLFRWDFDLTHLPLFLMGMMLVILAFIGLGVHKVQQYIRDAITYRDYL